MIDCPCLERGKTFPIRSSSGIETRHRPFVGTPVCFVCFSMFACLVISATGSGHGMWCHAILSRFVWFWLGLVRSGTLFSPRVKWLFSDSPFLLMLGRYQVSRDIPPRPVQIRFPIDVDRYGTEYYSPLPMHCYLTTLARDATMKHISPNYGIPTQTPWPMGISNWHPRYGIHIAILISIIIPR